MCAEGPAPWAATRAEWIVVDTEAYAFACTRCGGRVPFPVPVELFDWTERAQAFVADHAGCKDQAPAAVQAGML